jgi:hypothetical protein
METQKPQIAKTVLSKKEKWWRNHNTDFKRYYRAIAIKTA